jgi:hypothetical protein
MYSVELGRFVSRDPIGYVGGTNLYGYVGGRPTRFIDPSGLYDSDVHFYFNYYLARYLCLTGASGFITGGVNVSDAYIAAWMAQRVDDDWKTEPYDPSYRGIASGHSQDARHRFHFADNSDNTTVANDSEVRAAVKGMAESGDPAQFGIYLHIYADTFSHQGYGDFWGHMTSKGGGHDVDRPYLNQERDKRMAQAAYDVMLALAKARGVCCDWSKKSFDDFWNKIKDTLFTESVDEGPRVEAWKKLIKNDLGVEVEYEKVGRSDFLDPWVKRFRENAAKVPKWHNNGGSK